MAITQLSAFLENTPGTLYKAVSALSVADTKDFGILRVIVSDIEKTKEVLSGDTVVKETRVIAAKMSDKAGALKEILKIIQETGVNIEYVYAFTAAVAGSAYVVLRVDDIDEAETVLKGNGIKTLSDADIEEIL